MRVFGVSPRKLWSYKWLRLPILTLGVVILSLAIWFGLRMTGVSWLVSPWTRGGLIALILGAIALSALIKYLRRRKASKALEETLVTPGDGDILSERMQEALGRLKKSGGATYLYDLPWYVIIGPPGAGKTTALLHCGLDFPGTDKEAVAGFGGTKNCDFWFAEDAVLIDTAGRYTTQDSDATADRESWQSFLSELKKARSDQPVNGVLLAFSCEDIMTADAAQLERHALTVRQRLAELNKTLRIDVPVYVMFTKADIVAGFRDYFGPLGEDRRRRVWGVTFQTRDRKEDTYKEVSAEFDKLISRLSDEVTDRLHEEHDPVARISIFGFPGQMALMQRNLTDFLRRVFQKPEEVHAILRGFYFTSGTQEGTPIDQVLGAMASGHDQNAGFQPGFMSGKGRSYFLHDLLKKVIFAERDWVGYDFKSMRRRRILRTGATGLIATVCLGAMGLFGYSFWQNATLVRQANTAMNLYTVEAQDIFAEPIITDPATRPVLGALNTVRNLPGGFGDTTEQPFVERMGLSRRDSIRKSATESYSYALEHMLRPRMMLQLENTLPQLLATQDYEEAYRALKVYLLVAKAQPGKGDDTAIQSWFAEAWAREYSEPGLEVAYGAINDHLDAMLALDDRVTPALQPNKELVETAQRQIATLPLARQAYSSILGQAAGMTPLNVYEQLSDTQVDQVLRTVDGTALSDLTVPGLFTFSGYWGVFKEELASAQSRLDEERWVVGEPGKADYQTQLVGLNRDIHALYQADFVDAWQGILNKIELVPMADPSGQYTSLTIAAAPYASPVLKLAEMVDRETRLSRFLDIVENMEISPEALASGDMSGELSNAGFSAVERRSGSFERIFLNALKNKAKFQERAAPSATAPTERRQIENIERRFEKWHALVKGDADQRKRPIDAVLASLEELLQDRKFAASGGETLNNMGLQSALGKLTQGVPFYPDTMVRFVNQIEREFLTVTTNANMEELQRLLSEEVTTFCTQNVSGAFPFAANGRHISTAAFGEFFGYGGRMEKFYDAHLREYTQRSPNGEIVPRDDSDIGDRLAPATLAQFGRAERIRQAFFEPGNMKPSVSFTLSQRASSETVESVAMSFGGRQAQLFPNSSGITMSWPDDVTEVVFQLLPKAKRGAANGLRFADGRWALAEFINAGVARPSGSRVDVTHNVGGRPVTFRLEFDSVTVPFLMKELRDFSCPTTLE
ncbi:type VI secretion system membrane subunit TssM [Celeribacter naphthalenivorans]|uniref:type VI secretion system membrane subunit TssM n=1 Tax=Celeribacter naphthalenivorans TaxID=1614694 RepID=UPI001CFBD7CE|nr:type VI secretion system membrane subunit TssM [Celeribacter naphthalenivorans]